MRLWKVKVLYEYGPKPRRGWCTVLVEADTSDAAMALGASAAESYAPSDRKWNFFEAREAASVQLPVVLNPISLL